MLYLPFEAVPEGDEIGIVNRFDVAVGGVTIVVADVVAVMRRVI
ncbi:hypothetical protein [Natronorubrum sp. FCH18a]